MAKRGSDGGRWGDVTVRPCSLFALCSVLVILTCVPLNVGSREKCCHVSHICTFMVAEPGSGFLTL